LRAFRHKDIVLIHHERSKGARSDESNRVLRAFGFDRIDECASAARILGPQASLEGIARGAAGDPAGSAPQGQVREDSGPQHGGD